MLGEWQVQDHNVFKVNFRIADLRSLLRPTIGANACTHVSITPVNCKSYNKIEDVITCKQMPPIFKKVQLK